MLGDNTDPLTEEQFAAMFREYFARLVSFCNGYTRSTEASEDVVADVFTSIWNARASWNPGSSVAAYLYGAVRNRALSALRNAGAESRAYDQMVIESDDNSSAGDAASDVLKAIYTLPQQHRSILILRVQDNLSYADIAAIYGISEAGVRKQVERAVQALKAAIK